MASTEDQDNPESLNFIQTIIEEDLQTGKHRAVRTRFPPEPNGYLHIGHAKSICLNFGLAEKYNGTCHLRFDDTNPAKEDTEYTRAIMEDVKWLGFNWGDNLFHTSDYFEKLYGYAVQLIEKGKAYVCSLSAEQTREYRGTLKEPGRNSPYRERTVEENLELFKGMRDGQFEEGAHILRAKIDMSSANLSLRDPPIYRVRKIHHHKTGDAWCVYPMYDFAHGLSDAIEGITHSVCTLEFVNNRALYDWFINEIDTEAKPQQIEFARLNLTYTVLSKRKLLQLVEEGTVDGWNDPRMPTISGMRRRGYPPKAIREFCHSVGVKKNDAWIDPGKLEHFVREELNERAPRVMAVLKPLKVIIDNYPEGQEENLQAANHPTRDDMGHRTLPFSRELFIERDDFMEEPPKKFFRLAPGREVRLRYAYYITCQRVVKDPETNEVIALHCTYDPETKGGKSADGRKIKATLHWVSAPHAISAPIRLYDRLFSVEQPDREGDFHDFLNPDSLETLSGAQLEPSLKTASGGAFFQFERLGYYCVDSKDSSDLNPIFNRITTLRDAWKRIQKRESNRTPKKK
jgi:glutaminyl-tRNA synthetase